MTSVSGAQHRTLANGEETVFFTASFDIAGLDSLEVRGFQVFRGEIMPPKTRDKNGSYWPVFRLGPRVREALASNLRSQELHLKWPGVEWPEEIKGV